MTSDCVIMVGGKHSAQSVEPGPALANWRPCSQWCAAKNIGGYYTLETRRRSAEQRTPKVHRSAPRGWSSWGGVSPP